MHGTKVAVRGITRGMQGLRGQIPKPMPSIMGTHPCLARYTRLGGIFD
jgi:hypothetical protein